MVDHRLLILDDDPMIGETIQRIAELAGLEAHFTSNQDLFFSLLTDWKPTHIALDLIMPEMDGVQVMAELAQRSCRARIIITSGVGGRILEAARRSAEEHGLDIVGILAKPFSPSRLRDLLWQDPAVEPEQVPLPSAQGPGGGGQHWPELTAADLQQALARRDFCLLYQPKITCATGALAGVEALVRWVHPDRGMIPPIEFIPLAEATGLIDQLTDQVIEQALPWFAALCNQSPSALSEKAKLSPQACMLLKLSVNISAKTLGNGALFERVRQRCQSLYIDPEHLILELTETSAMDDPVASLDLLTRLRIMGFHLSIDDFGTGFSSMLQLVRLPFSEIKVDKSFVMTAMRSPESRTVVKFIVDLGHSLGLNCTAEGVEDAETMAYLKEINCDLAQGYFIARPMTGDALWQWIQKLTPDMILKH